MPSAANVILNNLTPTPWPIVYWSWQYISCLLFYLVSWLCRVILHSGHIALSTSYARFPPVCSLMQASSTVLNDLPHASYLLGSPAYALMQVRALPLCPHHTPVFFHYQTHLVWVYCFISYSPIECESSDSDWACLLVPEGRVAHFSCNLY